MKKKEYRNYAILIITILFVLIITTGFSNIFGSDTDYINQHSIIPEYFRQLFYQTGKLFPQFAFNYGAGQNIFNLSYYGLFSPIILPSYLLPFMSMNTYITICNIIIVMASAILFYRWIKNHNYNDNISLIASLIFVLSESFIFHMHRHIMFVNYMPFLVMSLMGVDKLINDNKKSFLIISIFLMIMTSYYYSVGGILVVCIYYLYEYLNNNKKLKIKPFFKDGFKFIALILVSILMSSILLLPTIYTLFSGRGEAESSINLLSLFVPYLKIHKIFCGTYAIGLSMLAFISLLYLFYTKKKNNVILGIIICVILFIPIFRYILNGGLYLREKCFIPFMPLFGFLIAYFINDLFNGKIKIKKFIIYILFILVPLYFFNQKQYCYLYLILFVILLLLFDKYNLKKVLSFYLVGAALTASIIANLNEDFVSIKDYEKIFNTDISTSINDTILSDEGYYRFNNLMYPTKTVNKIYNPRYYSTNIYSSTYNNYYLNFVRNTFKNSMIEYNYFMVPGSNNLLFNTFMGVKYLNSDYDPGLGYEKVNNNIYINNNVFPMFYATDRILNEEEFDTFAYPYQTILLLNNAIASRQSSNSNIETFIQKLNLEYEVISKSGVSIIKSDTGYVLNVDDHGSIKLKLNEELKDKLLFINISGLKENSCNYDNISLKINNVTNILTCDTWIYANKNNTFRYVISDDLISELNIELSKGSYNIDEIETFVLDYENIKDIKNSLSEFVITDFKDDRVVGNIEVTNDSYFVSSLPYDEGFTVKDNGKKINYEIVNKGFVGFPLKMGKHEIEISYAAPWFKEAKIISLIGIIIFVLISISDFRKMKKY